MSEIELTQADIDFADSFTNPIDDPYLHRILVRKAARHRIAACAEKDAEIERLKALLREAVEQGLDSYYYDDLEDRMAAALRAKAGEIE